MRRFGQIVILALMVIVSFGFTTDNKFDTVDSFGNEFFNRLKTGDINKLLEMRINITEIDKIINDSDLSDDMKIKVKQMFTSDFTDSGLIENIKSGMDRAKSDIKSSKGKLKNITLIEVQDDTRALNNLPFVMGNINVLYLSNGKKGKISIEVMKTDEGWKIFDDIITEIEK